MQLLMLYLSFFNLCSKFFTCFFKIIKLECNCTLGYVTYNNETCNYKQKSQNTVYWISLLAGILGADWFYLANGFNLYIIIGIIKLEISLTFIIGISYICFCYICLFKYSKNKDLNNKKLKHNIPIFKIFCYFLIFCLFTSVTWYLIDIFRI